MDPLAVILLSAFSALMSLAVGGVAVRAILNNKLITIASHNEHMVRWQTQIDGLRQTIIDQEKAHADERVRASEVAERRIREAILAADARVDDKNRQLVDMARERDRLYTAIALADESYRAVTTAQLHAQDSGLHAVASVIRASPLFDPNRHPEIPTVVEDNVRRGGLDPGSRG